MGYLKPSGLADGIRVELPSDRSYWVEIKPVGTMETYEAIARQVQNPQRDSATHEAFFAKLEQNIVRWNLTDAEDKPLPVDRATLRLLASMDALAITSAIDKRDTAPSAAEKNA